MRRLPKPEEIKRAFNDAIKRKIDDDSFYPSSSSASSSSASSSSASSSSIRKDMSVKSMHDEEKCICGRKLVDCFTPDLCDRLNLTIAVGNFTIQEEAIAYKCSCGQTTLRRYRSDIAYHTKIERTVENPLCGRQVESDPFPHCVFLVMNRHTCPGFGMDADGRDCEYRDTNGKCHSADRMTIWKNAHAWKPSAAPKSASDKK